MFFGGRATRSLRTRNPLSSADHESTLRINIWPATQVKFYYYRKIPKISLGAYIFQRPFLRGLFLEGLIYERKFAFQNRLGLPYSCGRKFTVFVLFYFVFEANFQVQAPGVGGGGLHLEG